MSERPRKLRRPKIIGKPFKEGHTGGPGRPPASKAEKEMNKLTRSKFKAVVQKYLVLTKIELNEIIKDPTTPTLDVMVLSVMHHAIKQGDEKRLNWFLEQLFGKLKERKEVTMKATLEKAVDLKKLTGEELKQLQHMVDKCDGE